MTNKTEKQFFDIFGIEERELDYPDNFTYYPEITDRILLELICLQPLSIEFKYPRNIEELKNTLLGYYIEELSLFAEPSEAEIFKQQVQALFKENN